ncbi:MAG: hypothetical protein UW07_C0004G0015 [Candidatus Nomurabacteria bacterium GW2011_GWF2_43_8]|uniref:Uncharacterized protein n=3 Tax=Candidatus Nomuraibacteriota TaxID=1752729 RepID=A0A0G1FR97_9BACT|nr:MAG: hypothetical protein UV76_C0007G0014 [Candidatus Nomurabacteria bacterium GW2011_GWA2_43_15]KKT19125.1 MAG: hypothetical protein UW02_C0015G0029 [Candidatus Nomurabacteria bacterium GW2011_GWB1_43_7]KKT25016.1 MAG: hypothetical protein UW07_C0004G0015 [Candidatus Nomurabacteria bacterium GW2011_GWF2_43_8]
MSERGVLANRLVGKKLVGVEVGGSSSSLTHHDSGELCLIFEGGEKITITVHGFNSPFLRVEFADYVTLDF